MKQLYTNFAKKKTNQKGFIISLLLFMFLWVAVWYIHRNDSFFKKGGSKNNMVMSVFIWDFQLVKVHLIKKHMTVSDSNDNQQNIRIIWHASKINYQQNTIKKLHKIN
jgi:hypothetical protein